MSTIERFKNLLEYKKGVLYWKEDRGSQKCKGMPAGCLNDQGYLKLRIRELGGAISVHRIVYAMHHGHMPKVVDHINGIRSDNRIENLREVTRSQNGLNRGAQFNNRSGCKNVYPHKGRWIVALRAGKLHKYFGIFDDLELADLVAHAAREKYHGVYANHGAKQCL